MAVPMKEAKAMRVVETEVEESAVLKGGLMNGELDLSGTQH